MSISEEHAVAFRRLCEEDIADLLPIEHEAYPDPWTQGMFRQELTNQTSHFHVARLGTDIVGYCGFWLALDEMHITKVTVAESYRRRGFGHTLLSWLLHHAEGLGANVARLEVRESNEAAQRLYASLGFVEIGRRKGYYTANNETAIVMSRTLRCG